MNIRRIRESDREQLKKICIAQASARAREDPLYAQFTLAMYCEPYADMLDGFVLADDSDLAVGYIFGALTREKHREALQHYIPLMEELGEEYSQRVRGECQMYDAFQKEYPSHLHIDILEEYTGQGYGTKLMNALLAYLKEQGSKGVMLGVSPHNLRGIHFYQHCGFAILYEDGGYVMGKKL